MLGRTAPDFATRGAPGPNAPGRTASRGSRLASAAAVFRIRPTGEARGVSPSQRSAAVFAFWRAIDDLPAPVKLELTTVEQCLLQFLAATLDAGLRTGEGYSETLGELLLGEAFKLGERQCLAVGGRQFLNHTAKGFTQLASVFQFGFVRFAREFRRQFLVRF